MSPKVWYTICKQVNPDTGEESTYTSRELPEYPGKQVIGKTVHVTVDSEDPGKYKVDIDAITSNGNIEKYRKLEKERQGKQEKESLSVADSKIRIIVADNIREW